MKRKLLSLLVLLMTVVSGAWADSYLYLDDMSLSSATLKYGDVPTGKPYHYGYLGWRDNGYSGFNVFRSSCTTITVDATCGGFNGVNLSGLFKDFGALTTISVIENLNTSSVTDMGDMFYGCGSLTTLDLRGWNTSSVKSMGSMFANCINLTTLNISNWDTGSVIGMRNMFSNCQNLSAIIGIGSLNTSKVGDMGFMFYNCFGLTSLDLNGWNTASVTQMMEMFSGCLNLTTLNLSGWNTANVEHMYEMFNGCSGLTSLNLSEWNTANVLVMSGMFNGCSGLTLLDLSGWDTSKVDNMSSMFSGCSNLETIYVGDGWSTASVWDNGNDMFSGCERLPGWNSTDTPVTDVSMAKTTAQGGYLTATTYNLTAKQGATDEYWATFYSEMSNYQASEGTQVFAVKLTGTEITMIEITDRIVKSGEGVVLKNTWESSITMTPTTDDSEVDYSDNSLVGTKITITNPGNAYVLNKGEGGIGFYKLKDTGTIGANKAYLTSTASAREFIGFEEATGLKAIDDGQWTIDNVVYDLQGRRVQNPTKGLYIVNGKKVVIK